MTKNYYIFGHFYYKNVNIYKKNFNWRVSALRHFQKFDGILHE